MDEHSVTSPPAEQEMDEQPAKPPASVTLGDRMKSFEHTPRVPPYQAFIVRADGNRFSKYTKGLRKPFDVAFQRAMVRTANELLDYFTPTTAFVCSDEITLVFAPACTEDELNVEVTSGNPNLPAHIFNGRHNKIETLVSSKCSILFNKFMVEEVRANVTAKSNYYDEFFVAKVEGRDAIFDARLIPFPQGTEFEIVNNLIWRSCYDCYKNTVASYARHWLGRKQCDNKKSHHMIALMKLMTDFDFEKDVPLADKYGVFCKKIKRAFTNEKGETYTRYKHYNFCTNLLEQDRDKTLELFTNKYFDEHLHFVCREYEQLL